MTAGLKPCAVIHRDLWYAHDWTKVCREHGWSYEICNIGNDVFVAIPGEKWRLTALQSVYRDGYIYQWRDQYVEAAGRLLGYDQEDVDSFVALLRMPEDERFKISKQRWR